MTDDQQQRIRQEAVSAAIIGALHSSPAGGPWMLVEAVTAYDNVTRLTFAHGWGSADRPAGDRARVVVRVEAV